MSNNKQNSDFISAAQSDDGARLRLIFTSHLSGRTWESLDGVTRNALDQALQASKAPGRTNARAEMVSIFVDLGFRYADALIR